jgi:hypothetical protein
MTDEEKPVTDRPLGMDSRTAVETSSARHHGNVYVKAGAGIVGVLGSASVEVANDVLDALDDFGADADLTEVAEEVGRRWGWLGRVGAAVKSPVFWQATSTILRAISVGHELLPQETEECGHAIADALSEADVDPASLDLPEGPKSGR